MGPDPFFLITIHFNRWRLRRIQPDGKNVRWAFFTISSLLQVTVFIAVAASIAVSMPALNMRAWANVVLIGVVSGIATALAHWIALAKSPRWFVRIIVGLAASTCVSMSLVWGDWFVLSLVDLFSSWPPDGFELPGTFQFLAYESTFHPPVVWVPIMAGVTAAVSAVLWLSLCTKIAWPIAVFHSTPVGGGSEQETSIPSTGELAPVERPSKRVSTGWRRALPRCAYLLLIGLMMIPPASVYFELMTPLPIPNAEDPEPNGWNDFVAAGKMVENSAHLNILHSFDIASETELSKTVAALSPVYVR